jgi:hypothetical protein
MIPTLDFGIWILDFGLRRAQPNRLKLLELTLSYSAVP